MITLSLSVPKQAGIFPEIFDLTSTIQSCALIKQPVHDSGTN